MGKPAFPHSILEFQARFVDEQVCLDYLFACRWPDGFACPRCRGAAAWPLSTRRTWECTICHHQTSLTAGTVLQQDPHPSPAVVLGCVSDVHGDPPGISALQLQRQLGLGRYVTAWMMLHKLRRAMVAP